MLVIANGLAKLRADHLTAKIPRTNKARENTKTAAINLDPASSLWALCVGIVLLMRVSVRRSVLQRDIRWGRLADGLS